MQKRLWPKHHGHDLLKNENQVIASFYMSQFVEKNLTGQHQGEIVCVVLDLMMPNTDGEETLRELRRIQEDVKVVLSSGYHEEDVTERLAGAGFAGFVKKPYSAETLVGQLRQALEGGTQAATISPDNSQRSHRAR